MLACATYAFNRKYIFLEHQRISISEANSDAISLWDASAEEPDYHAPLHTQMVFSILGTSARVSTGVRATHLHRDNECVGLKQIKGELKAKAVVLGTYAYTDKLWPNLNRSFTLIHYFQLATKPLGPEADSILPERQGLWDTGQIIFNFRRDSFNRLLVGSMGTVIGNQDNGLSNRWARKQIARIFPGLGPVEFEQAWHGQIAMTPAHLPLMHQLDTKLFTPIGYNGRGITSGTLFVETMSGLLTGMNVADLPLPISELSTVPSKRADHDKAISVSVYCKTSAEGNLSNE